MSTSPFRVARIAAIHRAIAKPRNRTEAIETAEALAMILATVAGAINQVGKSDRAIEEVDWRITDAQRVLDLLEVPHGP